MPMNFFTLATPSLSTSEQTIDNDAEVQIKKSSGSWWKILKLGREEWILYIAAFHFLIIAAISKQNSIV